jgi:membrane-associated phospholipid phosphatase
MSLIQLQKRAEVSTETSGASTAVDTFHLVMALIVASLAGTLALIFRSERISIRLTDYSGAAQCVFCVAIAAAYAHWAGYVRLREACMLLMWSFLLVTILPLPQYAAARTAMPLHDALLARIDESIGINVGSIFSWSNAHPAINVFLGLCYSSLMPFVFFAMLLPPLFGHHANAKHFIMSVVLSVIAASLVLACFPATGPWEVYHYAPYPSQQRIAAELAAIRFAPAYTVDPSFSGGLIAFPSFHVALAIMSTRALWVFRLLRIPCVLMSACVAISTLSTGMHYGSDVIGGAALAVALGYVTRKFALATPRPRRRTGSKAKGRDMNPALC